MSTLSIPKSLQAVLWSVNRHNLDTKRDKVYIIHQILSFGNLGDINWLFKTYTRDEITKTFLNHPYKDYRRSRFYLVKNFLLSLKNTSLEEYQYVKNTPRDIR